MTDLDTVAQTYIRLALAIEQHSPGYVDAYYGPAEWRAQAEQAGPCPLADLLKEVEDLNASLARLAGEEDAQRHDYLSKEGRAMETTLRILQGEALPFSEQVEGLFDIFPRWVDESVFNEAHQILDALLPPGDSLLERMIARSKVTEISVERAEPLLHEIVDTLRRRTQARFPLPEGEAFELSLVEDKPWGAYNWYLGDFRSLIEVNTDLPLHITGLAGTMAHEGYPGHHTEHVIKEQRLFKERGYPEFAITVLYSPSCVLAEGIATRAMSMLLSDEEWIAWHADEIFPRADFAHLDAERERAIDKAKRALRAVPGNVAFLLHDQGVDEAEVVAYLQRYQLASEKEAHQMLRFLSFQFYGAYIFNYYQGGAMLDALFDARGERARWFARLLAEPVTPSQVRAWSTVGK